MSLGEKFLVTTISVLLKLTRTTTSVDREGWPWCEGDNWWSSTVSYPVSLDEESRSEIRTHLRSLQSHTTVVGVLLLKCFRKKWAFCIYPWLLRLALIWGQVVHWANPLCSTCSPPFQVLCVFPRPHFSASREGSRRGWVFIPDLFLKAWRSCRLVCTSQH